MNHWNNTLHGSCPLAIWLFLQLLLTHQLGPCPISAYKNLTSVKEEGNSEPRQAKAQIWQIRGWHRTVGDLEETDNSAMKNMWVYREERENSVLFQPSGSVTVHHSILPLILYMATLHMFLSLSRSQHGFIEAGVTKYFVSSAALLQCKRRKKIRQATVIC